jgi:DNA-directed RNA polymerase specialized sigma24 family protein
VEARRVDAQSVSAGASAGGNSPPGLEDFMWSSYRDLVQLAMYIGATKEEAEDAVGKTVLEMLPKWTKIRNPRAYARRAVKSNFIKEKTRNAHF